jgi:hypothetical protein
MNWYQTILSFMFPKFGATAKYTVRPGCHCSANFCWWLATRPLKWVLVGSVVSQCTGDIVIAAAMCYVLHDKSRGIPPDHGSALTFVLSSNSNRPYLNRRTRSVVTILFHYTLTTGVLTRFDFSVWHPNDFLVTTCFLLPQLCSGCIPHCRVYLFSAASTDHSLASC